MYERTARPSGDGGAEKEGEEEKRGEMRGDFPAIFFPFLILFFLHFFKDEQGALHLHPDRH